MDMNRICELALSLGCEVKNNVPMSEHCTFRVGGLCERFIEVSSAEALSQLISNADRSRVPYIVLGRGSNVIFDDRGYKGIVLHIGGMMDKIWLADETTVCAEAGAGLLSLCRFALENSLSGLEFAYGIPGSIGGAVFMNAGAYGGEIKDVAESVAAVSLDGTISEILNRDIGFDYRHSCFMDMNAVVVSARFKLNKADPSEIKQRMDELMSRRIEKQPLEFPSAGSTFKRPTGYFAGKLIQDSGLRGFSIGGAQVSEKHCGFVINKGGATASDILMLIDHIKKTVKENTGVSLECEVRYIPYE